MKISVLTPTYNRENLLKNLYNSLVFFFSLTQGAPIKINLLTLFLEEYIIAILPPKE